MYSKSDQYDSILSVLKNIFQNLPEELLFGPERQIMTIQSLLQSFKCQVKDFLVLEYMIKVS
jgi:hypothetical protein